MIDVLTDDNMAQAGETSEQNVRRYLRLGGASVLEIEDFFDWCSQLCRAQQEDAVEKRIRYSVYRLWAKLLRKRRTPFHHKDVFIYDESLKNYIRFLTGGEIVGQDPRAGAKNISASQFVQYVVRRLDDAF